MCDKKCRLAILIDEEIRNYETYDYGEARDNAVHRYALEQYESAEKAKEIVHQDWPAADSPYEPEKEGSK
jgi:hypothetical protein